MGFKQPQNETKLSPKPTLRNKGDRVQRGSHKKRATLKTLRHKHTPSPPPKKPKKKKTNII
jgi:hypothetical protein